jgi:2-amino-4-hydroxy-6-hydroxymethyldihydropteridine diphosphokinase
MAEQHKVFLLLGSNIHPRSRFLKEAEIRINKAAGKVEQRSSVFESEPWGFRAPVAFLNRILVIKTDLKPMELLKKTQEIERRSGRMQKSASAAYDSRTLDIDILYFDDRIIHLPELTVPHPQIARRRFTLLPLAEIAPERVHPVLKRNHRQLLAECRDNGKVWKHKEKQGYAV